MTNRRGVRFVRNVLWGFGGQAWSMGLGLISAPYIANKLGADLYGLLIFAGYIASFVIFLEFGMPQAATRFMAMHAAREEWREVRQVFWSALITNLILGGLGALLFILAVSFFVIRWLSVPEALLPTAYRIFYWSGIGFWVNMLTAPPMGICIALQRLDVVNRLNVAITSGQTLLAVGLLAKGFSVEHMVMGNVIVQLVGFGAYLWVAHRLLPNWGKPVWHAPLVRKLLRFGGWISVGGIVTPALLNTEKVFLGRLLSTAAVAYYGVSYNLVSRLAMAASTIGGALFPLFSSLQATDPVALREANFRVSRFIVLLLWPLTLLLTFWGADLLHVWMGASYAEKGALPLALLAWATLINAAAWSPFILLQTSGRPDIPTKIRLVEFFLYLPFAWYLISWLGINGAALAYLFQMVLDSVLLYMAVARVYEVQWRPVLQSLVRPMGSILIGVLGVWGISEVGLANASSFWRLGVGAVGVGLVSAGALWIWLVEQPEYAVVREIVGSFLHKAKLRQS